MSSSIFTGVSGLRANQDTLNVVGNNLANVNTTGYKTQRANFSDLFYRTLSGATGPSTNIGGTNPMQTGFGTRIASIDSLLTQGVLEPTGNDLDLGIEGNGFFMVSNGTESFFTRAGAFGIDASGYLVDPSTGFFVQRHGTVGEGSATLPAFQTAGDNRINIPFGAAVPGQETTNVLFRGNLNALAAIGETTTTAIQIFDMQGMSHLLNLVFTKTANNTWDLVASIPPSEGTMISDTVSNITFNNDGSLAGPATGTISFQITALAPSTQTVTLDFGLVNGFNGLTQFGGSSSAAAINQNGFAPGFLNRVSFDKDGTVNGVFSNGQVLPLAQLAIATFPNPAGLRREGNNYFSITSQSGNVSLGAGLSGGRGSVNQAVLEGSNVDIALEFTRLIIAQRGFEVNARTIQVSSQVLQTLTTLIQ
ncbi:MAG: flagellar hook protein FlgE [Gemmatales bacterium]|nr:MAG: flagellar hook protein FlgE [Gemmatales bacterium]